MNKTIAESLQAKLARIPLLEAALEHAQRTAETDSLTGLFNRRGIERRSANPKDPEGGRRYWYVACDLDGFKAAQDRPGHGHRYGDRVLREFSHFLETKTRAGDSVRGRVRAWDSLCGRTGGDEFLILVDSRAGARRIRDLVREWHSKDLAVTASAGMGQDEASADAACYLHKRRKAS